MDWVTVGSTRGLRARITRRAPPTPRLMKCCTNSTGLPCIIDALSSSRLDALPVGAQQARVDCGLWRPFSDGTARAPSPTSWAARSVVVLPPQSQRGLLSNIFRPALELRGEAALHVHIGPVAATCTAENVEHLYCEVLRLTYERRELVLMKGEITLTSTRA